METFRLAECPFCGSFDVEADVRACTRCSFEGRAWQVRNNHPVMMSELDFLEARGQSIRAARASGARL
jgi:hypothetical protein